MAGLGGPSGAAPFPVLALVLALLVLGYSVRDVDHLAAVAAGARYPVGSAGGPAFARISPGMLDTIRITHFWIASGRQSYEHARGKRSPVFDRRVPAPFERQQKPRRSCAPRARMTWDPR